MSFSYLHFYSTTITATASTKEKLDWLLSLPAGATHAVNYKTQDFAEETKKITDGKGIDVLIDFVGQSPINLWQSPDDEYSTLHTVSASRCSDH